MNSADETFLAKLKAKPNMSLKELKKVSDEWIFESQFSIKSDDATDMGSSTCRTGEQHALKGVPYLPVSQPGENPQDKQSSSIKTEVKK